MKFGFRFVTDNAREALQNSGVPVLPMVPEGQHSPTAWDVIAPDDTKVLTGVIPEWYHYLIAGIVYERCERDDVLCLTDRYNQDIMKEMIERRSHFGTDATKEQHLF